MNSLVSNCRCGGVTGYFYYIGKTKLSCRWGKKPRPPGRNNTLPTSARCRDCDKRMPMKVAVATDRSTIQKRTGT